MSRDAVGATSAARASSRDRLIVTREASTQLTARGRQNEQNGPLPFVLAERYALVLGTMSDGDRSRRALTDTILEKIVSGALPNVTVERTRTGPGTNRMCYGCERPIGPTELQDDIELGRTVMVRLHHECFLVWQAEMSRLGRVISGGSGELLDLEAFLRRIARQTRLLTLSVDIRVRASQTRIRSREARRCAERSLARSLRARAASRAGWMAPGGA